MWDIVIELLTYLLHYWGPIFQQVCSLPDRLAYFKGFSNNCLTDVKQSLLSASQALIIALHSCYLEQIIKLKRSKGRCWMFMSCTTKSLQFASTYLQLIQHVFDWILIWVNLIWQSRIYSLSEMHPQSERQVNHLILIVHMRRESTTWSYLQLERWFTGYYDICLWSLYRVVLTINASWAKSR